MIGVVSNKKIAYFSGCFANYYYPEVGDAVMKTMHKNAVEIVVPRQVCCGLPIIAKGNLKDAFSNMNLIATEFSKLAREGYAVVTTCSSCGLFLKRDLPHFLPNEDSKLVSANLYHATEYLMELHKIGQLNMDFRRVEQRVFYHQPCHLRAQQIGNPSAEILEMIPGTVVHKESQICCGMSGAYGYEKRNYSLSKDIAGKLYDEIKKVSVDRFATDCGGCRLQIQGGTDRPVDHPIILLREAWIV